MIPFVGFKQPKTSTATEVIKYLQTWFATHGIPESLEYDNTAQESSKNLQ